MTWNKFIFALTLLPVGVQASPFATAVTSYSNLGVGIYGDPTSVLGPPTRWVRDTINGGLNQRVAPGIGYATWNVSPEGNPLITTIRPGGHITVEFSPPLLNQVGPDFIVFGNALIGTSEEVSAETNPDTVFVLGGPDFIEPMPVSASNDGFTWRTFVLSPAQGADGYWPTQAFDAQGQATDFNLPVPESLTRNELSGLTLRQAVAKFRRSGGGTAFDLTQVGLKMARYIRISGTGGELDAIARVINPSILLR
ncbi:MAG: hypothetical protein JNK63_07770 [Chthonomonas sp.]|nr:hypothetical protein [Chthonomonas sp.]